MSNFFTLIAQLQSYIDNLDSILAGGDSETVNINGASKSTISKAIKDKFSAIQAMVQGRLTYETKAAMDAAGAPPSGELSEVWKDATESNNGLYGYSGGAWVKSVYDTPTLVANLQKSINGLTYSLESHGLGLLANEFPNGNLSDLGDGVYLHSDLSVNGPLSDVFEPIVHPDLNAMGINHAYKLDLIVQNRHFIHDLPEYASGKYVIATWISYAPSGILADHGNSKGYTGINGGLGDGINGATNIQEGAVDFGDNCRLHWKRWKYWNFDPELGETAQVWVGSSVIGSVDNNVYLTGFNYAISEDAVDYTSTAWDKFIPSGILEDVKQLDTKIYTESKKLSALIAQAVLGGEVQQWNNAVVGRYGSIGEAVNPRWAGRGDLTYEAHSNLLNSEGHRNVIRAVSTNTAAYYPLIGVRVDLEDLAKVGIVPDDTTPPLISMKACWTRTYEADHTGIQIFYLLRYGTNTSVIYNSSQDVLFNSASGNGAYLGAGDSSWDHTVTAISTEDKQGWKHEGIPLPATYNGQPLTAVIINLIGKAKTGYVGDDIKLEGVDFAVVPGATIDALDPYFNKPDDYPKVQNIEEEQLSQTLRNKLVFAGETAPNLITIQNSDKITVLGDSYSASHYTPKDKAYISRLAELTDWRIENFARSGDDYLELNQRILGRIAEYHSSLSFKDYGSTYALLISWTNDVYARTSDTHYWFDNIKRLIETVKACGAHPILSTEFVDGSMFEFAGLSAIAKEHHVPFFDIMSNAHLFNVSQYSQYWGGGHPAVRTNGLFYEPLLKHIDSLPRPKQSIKLFRKRPVFAVSADSDLLYDDIAQRVKRWQEITVGHVALVDRLAPYYDRMDDIASAHGGYSYDTHDSEYLQLQNNEIVNFGNYMLAEVILPTTASRCSSVTLNFGVSDAEVYVRNALPVLNYSAYTKHQAFEVNAPVGAVPGDQYAVNGETFTIVAEVIDYDGTNLIIASTYKWSSGGVGTLTKVSGSGPSSINYNATRYGFDPEYYDGIGKPRGEWLAITNNTGSATLTGELLQKAMNYDKVVFLVKKVGDLLISDINVEWVGIESKAPLVNPKLEHNNSQNQVLSNSTFVDMTNWIISGSVNPTTPHDGILPKGMTKLVKVSTSNRIMQSVNLSHANRYNKTVDIVVWARRYPTHFNPSSNEAVAAVEYQSAPITSDTCDYAELSIRLFDGEKRDGVVFKELVGLHWQECRFRVDIGSNNIAKDGVELEVFCEADELEIALVEVWS